MHPMGFFYQTSQHKNIFWKSDERLRKAKTLEIMREMCAFFGKFLEYERDWLTCEKITVRLAIFVDYEHELVAF